MTIAKTLAAALSTAALVAACAEQEDTTAAATFGAPQPIHLAVGIGTTADAEWTATAGTTRATTAIQSTQLAENEHLWVYFANGVRVNTKTYDCGTALKTTDAVGTTGVVTPAEQPYFIETATAAKASVYYPYTADGSKRVTQETTEFTVEANQSDDAAYKKSDLMWGKATISRSKSSNDTGNTTAGSLSASATVTMAHLLSKLTFTVKPATTLTVKAVRIVGGRKNCALAVTKDAQQEITSVAAAEPTTADELSPSHYVTVWQGSQNTEIQASCILPPQEYDAAANFVQVVTDQGIINYRITSGAEAADRTTAAGRNHTITLPVQAAFVNQTVDMAQWQTNTWNIGTDGHYAEAKQVQTFSASAGSRTPYSFNMIRVKADGTNVASDYYLAETECTNGLWYAIMGTKPQLSANPTGLSNESSDPNGGQRRNGDEYPVSYVNITDVLSFITSLNNATTAQRPKGYVFALPTKAQWQWAARNRGNSTVYMTDADAWHGNTDKITSGNAGGTTHPVAEKNVSQLGFYDLGGNVQEWVATDTGYGNMNGGYLNPLSPYMTSDYMSNEPTTTRKNDLGFRLALVRGGATLGASVRVGDIIANDGKTYASLSSIPAGVKPEAVVCQIWDSGAHGRAIAIHDVATNTMSLSDAQAAPTSYSAAHSVPGATWALPGIVEWYSMSYYLAVELGKYTEDDSNIYTNYETIWDIAKTAGGEAMSDDVSYWTDTADSETNQKVLVRWHTTTYQKNNNVFAYVFNPTNKNNWRHCRLMLSW